MKIQTGDKVKVITGKDKGKEGTVVRVHIKAGSVVVEGVNMTTRHLKATKEREGGIIKLEKPINVSNVMLIDGGKANRIGYKIVDGKKYRVAKKSGEVIKGKKK
jgi:large subunit ribosomal protein L24